MQVYVHACSYLQRPEEGVETAEARVTGSRELLKVDARNQTQVLSRSNRCS